MRCVCRLEKPEPRLKCPCNRSPDVHRLQTAMINYSILFIVALGCCWSGNVNADCQDNNGRTVSEGKQYIPGPDTCTLCVCDNFVAKWCQAVLCSPPQVNVSVNAVFEQQTRNVLLLIIDHSFLMFLSVFIATHSVSKFFMRFQ